MDEPQDKQELLERVHKARSALWKEVQGLSADRLTEPGVQGVWSVKDIVAHVVAWDDWLLGRLREAARGEPLTTPTWTSVDARNEAIYQEWKDRPLPVVLAEFTRMGVELHQALDALSEEQLFTPGLYGGPGSRGLHRMVAADTWRHYASHLRAIQGWLAEDSGDPRAYYAYPGPVTHPHGYGWMLDGLPTALDDLVQVVQGLMLHPYWTEAYGVTLSEERQQEPALRLVTRMLARIRELDPRPLKEPRDLDHRLVGNCRDHTVLLTAMLRHQGVPARARCGFGAYFMPNHYEDHWVAEYWNGAEQRWVLVDAQLDALQRERLQIHFSPLDVPRDQFVVAGQAWQMCRSGQADPDTFGIFDMHGLDFVRGNLVRDLLALNKVEILPWDQGFGYLTDEPLQDLALADRWAALTTGGDAAFAGLRELYRADERLHVPEEWLHE